MVEWRRISAYRGVIMQAKSLLYTSIFRSGNYTFEPKITINDIDYGQDVIYSLSTDSKIFSDKPSIGGVYSAVCEFKILSDGLNIPRMAKCVPYYRIKNETQTSEWIKKGEFFIDTRKVSSNNNGISVFEAECYDSMMKANGNYSESSLSWPATDVDVVAEICSQMGVSQDRRNASIMTQGYSIPLPVEYTKRDVLSYIAVMYGANWIMTDDGMLRLVPLVGNNDVLSIGQSVTNLEMSPTRPPYTQVVMSVSEESAFISGNDESVVMEAYCPFATQAAADFVYDIVSNWEYEPFEATGVWSDPAVELGDKINVVAQTGLTIFSRNITFGNGMVYSLSAPIDNFVDHEYSYESSTDRRYKRTLGELSSQISIIPGEIELITEKINNIGGKNIIINTLTPDVSNARKLPRLAQQDSNTSAQSGATFDVAEHGFRATSASATRPHINFGSRAIATGSMNGLVAGETYTWSFTAQWKVRSAYTGQENALMRVYLYTDSRSPGESFRADVVYDIDTVSPATSGIERMKDVKFTFTVPERATALYLRVTCNDTEDANYLPGDYLQLSKLKLESGGVATAWSPAPEDMVGNDEIVSKINLSPEIIKIEANKIDLQGYVTITNLAGSGQTVINGDNITTGIIQDTEGKNSWNLETGEVRLQSLDLVIDKVDHIGGTNLIINTLNPSVERPLYYPRIYAQNSNTQIGIDCIATTAEHGIRTSSPGGQIPNLRFGSLEIESATMNGLLAGEPYTLSGALQIKMLSNYTGTSNYQVRARLYTNANNPGVFAVSAAKTLMEITPADAGQTKKDMFEWNFEIPSAATKCYLIITITDNTLSDYAAGDYLQVSNIKLELGKVATAWSAAPEDYVGNDEIITKINLSQEAAQISANKISLYGKEIELTSDEITIESDNFTVDKNGNVIARSITILGGTFKQTASKTYLASNYAQSDIDRVTNIITHSVNPTATDYSKYDIDMDGIITIFDLVSVRNMVLNGEDEVVDITTEINPNTLAGSIRVSQQSNGQSTPDVSFLGGKRTVSSAFMTSNRESYMEPDIVAVGASYTSDGYAMLVKSTGTGGTVGQLRLRTNPNATLLEGLVASPDGISFDNNMRYPASGLSVSTLNGSLAEVIATSGTTKTYTLESGTYLVTTGRINSTSVAQDGMWLVVAHQNSSGVGNGHITTMLTPTGGTTVTMTDNKTLQIVTGSANVRISIIKLG